MSDEDSSKELSATAHGSDILTEGARHRPNARHRAVTFKVSHILVSLFFVWLSIIHIIGLFLFTKGFLLTRLVLEDKSSCDILPNGLPAPDISDGCWHPRTFKKAVVIIIDALRYDFTVPSPSPEAGSQPKYYHNNLPFLYNTAIEHPEQAFLLPFIADPPTSTLQRLKGLTAGNLPTFIDIGSNFAGQATEEDNILVQLKDQGKTIVHLGDDTWHSLFPGYFDQNLTHAYDSFNVWDLHTVDNGVIEHIFPLLDNQKSPHWDIVFAHFLGVDHAGHRYGPEHPAMAEKLRQMNDVLERLTQQIDGDTVLVVMGDHGMDSKGDHGGESDDEVEATLWMYSNRPRFGRLTKNDIRPPATAKERPVEQIDLVSTLSLLLGLPVPFNNLGTPIAEAFVRNTPATQRDQENLAEVNLLVFEQMKRYQSKYAEARDFTEDESIASLRTQLGLESTRGQDANTAFSQWHAQTVTMYRQLWANFNLQDMAIGVGILLSGLTALLLVAELATSEFEKDLLPILRYTVIGTAVGIAAAAPGLVLHPTLTQILSTTGLLALAAGGSIAGAITSRIARLSNLRSRMRPSAWTCLAFFFTISQAAGFASNSYTIHEDTILTFLLGTFSAFSLLSSLRQKSGPDRVLGVYHSVLFMALTRAASVSRLCREEQMPGCRSTFYASQTSSTSAPWQLLIPSIVSFLLPEIIKAFYKGTASYVGSAGFWIGLCFRAGLMLTALYWITDAADNGDWLADTLSSVTLKTISITIARCVFAVAVPVGFSTFVWSKPCVDISILDLPSPTASGEAKPQITVLGYANAFGSRYFLLIPAFVLSIILLLPPMGQYALAICTWQILCLLEILDTNGLTVSRVAQPYIGPVVLAMLGSYHFFKTGHQAVLSSIQWNAAFVPLRTIRYPWSPLLILLNNFGPQILCAAAVPLTVLWKRPVSKQGLKGYWSDIMQACMAHLLYYATIQAATTIWAGHLRRHLMLYRVFMPRFLMGSVILLVVDLMLIVVALGGSRVTGSSIAEIFGH
ncbi:mannose-ethanolamine phosphotransferase gpi13 [Exophiala xenobiotica]|uniref:Mannose-ethanolamine phosphotransferase gpi13 n=1 Tax=Lithohypha guttulata TaxID=1690604 RepID=A0ABR0KGV9_9EURO|nr:mannose-ethanolamine phosphotransferase gpi13 [Lithohypha guttulata]KAK5322255.1 mannose-ethanolamine phosphotransferase gpi13 [Exophiala xenobiotica]